MRKYIDAEKLIAEIERRLYFDKNWIEGDKRRQMHTSSVSSAYYKRIGSKHACESLLDFVISLQQEQPDNMIQWTGSNLQEVIDFTGKSPKFGEWFKSWDEFESYVHSHGDILKLSCEDGSHFEVPVGAWIVKTPDGYNVPSIARFIHAKQEQPDVDF